MVGAMRVRAWLWGLWWGVVALSLIALGMHWVLR